MPLKRSKPRKPYEKRVDLMPYQRVLRFLRGMSPHLSAGGVLRMLQEANEWSEEMLDAKATALTQALEQARLEKGIRARINTLPALIPYIVTGAWAWPEPLGESSWLKQAATPRDRSRVVLRQSGPRVVPGLRDDDPVTRLVKGLPHEPARNAEPVLLAGHCPTVEGLCQVADDLRRILQRLMEEWPDVSYDTFLIMAEALDDRLCLRFAMRDDFSTTRGRGTSFAFTEAIRGSDFSAYCVWQLARLLVKGHGWRLTSCGQCGHVLLKTRQDPSGRPSRFCGDGCRHAWHNSRRPKKARIADGKSETTRQS